MSEPIRKSDVALAVETSGRLGSIALGRGDAVLEAARFSTTRQHAVELLPTADMLCRKHKVKPREIAEIYVSGGPGSFTGLRIGITFAKTLALDGRTRIVRVPTLDVIAQNALLMDAPPAHLAVILDAKRKHVYAARFEPADSAERFYKRIVDPAEVDPAEFLAQMPPTGSVVGEGIAYHREAVSGSGLSVLPEECNQARAEVVYRLGRQLAAAGLYHEPTNLVPIYIRRPEAEEVYEQRHL
ncbi:MAG: tRNA (adenosine(37)-N6)-threonylcarbamoyltransferase complex dimerization subunit type 1 TsaB [Phycisphaerae bacterium]|nr:tRNA (adenosine(37)-N6)-threonylcarbamoyltransferase complex dimerization subunit type 1 TsaB [Phycisphaerae bacterium]